MSEVYSLLQLYGRFRQIQMRGQQLKFSWSFHTSPAPDFNYSTNHSFALFTAVGHCCSFTQTFSAVVPGTTASQWSPKSKSSRWTIDPPLPGRFLVDLMHFVQVHRHIFGRVFNVVVVVA